MHSRLEKRINEEEDDNGDGGDDDRTTKKTQEKKNMLPNTNFIHHFMIHVFLSSRLEAGHQIDCACLSYIHVMLNMLLQNRFNVNVNLVT